MVESILLCGDERWQWNEVLNKVSLVKFDCLRCLQETRQNKSGKWNIMGINGFYFIADVKPRVQSSERLWTCWTTEGGTITDALRCGQEGQGGRRSGRLLDILSRASFEVYTAVDCSDCSRLGVATHKAIRTNEADWDMGERDCGNWKRWIHERG
jgi:hypothetical protein